MLHTKDLAAYLEAHWPTEVTPSPTFFRPGTLFLPSQPDRVVLLALSAVGTGEVTDNYGLPMQVGVSVVIRGDQRNPDDAETLAWTLDRLIVSPHLPRYVLTSGLTVVTAARVTMPSAQQVSPTEPHTVLTASYALTVTGAPT